MSSGALDAVTPSAFFQFDPSAKRRIQALIQSEDGFVVVKNALGATFPVPTRTHRRSHDMNKGLPLAIFHPLGVAMTRQRAA